MKIKILSKKLIDAKKELQNGMLPQKWLKFSPKNGWREMMYSTQSMTTLKKRLLENLERIPETDIQEILDFVEFMLTRRHKKKIPKKVDLDPTRDPVLKLVGIANVEPFSKKINRELYGQ